MHWLSEFSTHEFDPDLLRRNSLEPSVSPSVKFNGVHG